MHNPDLNQQTILTVDQEGRVVDLLGIDILSLQGVTIKAANVSSTDDQVINVEEAKLILKDCELLANLTASTNTGIRVGNAGELVMERTRLQMHSTGSTRKRTALLLEGGNSRLANDIILVDGADYLIGLDHRSGSVLLSHLSMLVGSDNAIEAAGVSLRDGAANIVNSLILTAGAQDQAPLECRGESMIGVRVVNNLLSSFGGQDPQPLLVDCRGNYFMPSDLRNVNLTISDGEVRDTIISSASVISEVVDLNTWQLIGPDGVDAADLSADQAEGVIDDFASTLRPPLNDIGAFGGI